MAQRGGRIATQGGDERADVKRHAIRRAPASHTLDTVPNRNDSGERRGQGRASMTCRTTREDTPIGGARARHRWTAFDKCAVSAAAIVRAHRRTRRNARAQRDRMFAVVPPISQTGMPNGYGPDHQRWPAKGLAPAEEKTRFGI